MTMKFSNRNSALDSKQISPELWKIHEKQIGNAQESVARVKHNMPVQYQSRAAAVCDFYLFCHERQSIWKRRYELGNTERPWTQDKIMHKSFFCNIYRELDSGTIYFQRHINRSILVFEKGSHTALEKVLWASLCYRMMNQQETFMNLKGIPNVENYRRFQTEIKFIKKNGGTCFTNAHQTMGFDRYYSLMDSLLMNKCELLKELSVEIFNASNNTKTKNGLEHVFNTIKTLPNVGDFLAWQVTCDLLESNVLPLCHENQFVQLGPGAKTGLSIIFGDKVNNGGHLQLTNLLKDLQLIVIECLGIDFPYLTDGKSKTFFLTLKNIEHALCEYQKYVNIKISRTGRGRCYNYQSTNYDDCWFAKSIVGGCYEPVKSVPYGCCPDIQQMKKVKTVKRKINTVVKKEAKKVSRKIATVVKKESPSRVKNQCKHRPKTSKRVNVAVVKKKNIVKKENNENDPENALPAGWTMITTVRKSGKSAGHLDSYWFSPIEKKKIRSKRGLKTFLELLEKYNNDENMAYKLLPAK